MAKDYFEDIIPPDQHDRRRVHPSSDEGEESSISSDRSIRNVQINPRGRRPNEPLVPPRPRRAPRRILWFIAAGFLVVLAAFAFLALRPTSVTVTPRSHKVVFDDASEYSAYPAESASAGALSYTSKSFDLDDSDTVSSAGVVHAEDRASGQVTVYNNYATTPVKLVKNTRFSTPEGLIFRVPSDIVAPGKTAANPGKVVVTVVADQPGEQYNVGPIAKLTVPGLKGSAEYNGVYASSQAAFSGGFVGDKPGVSEADTEKAIAAIRSRLADKARTTALALATKDMLVFPNVMQITYRDDAPTPEAGGRVRIHETAHIDVPLFPAKDFASSVAASVSTNADGVALTLVPGNGYDASLISASSTVGTDPLQFKLVGKATIVWIVDTDALAKALAGRDQGAFQTVVTGFPSIQEAHARIEPFWSSVFPKDPKAIKIIVLDPTKQG